MLDAAGAPDGAEWLVIAVSGVTCGGKTTLADQLLRALTPVYVFHQDQYFYPDDSPRHVRCEALQHNNYDVLGALDMRRMLRDVRATLAGEDRAHARCTARAGRRRLPGRRVLVLEGFTVLNYEPLARLADLCYYFVLSYGECFARRVMRTYSPPDVPGYFESCVWPAHLQYRAEVERNPRVQLLDGTNYDAFDIVMAELDSRGARKLS